MQNVNVTTLIVWLIIGALGGYIAGIIIRDRRRGFGVIGNIVIGLIGALIGGFLFQALGITVGSSIQIGGDDVLAAVVGSLILIFVLSLVRIRR
jgi:uncharacterized membrane protein YeaQ/YmgE (transglycosylase-associated protein family)